MIGDSDSSMRCHSATNASAVRSAEPSRSGAETQGNCLLGESSTRVLATCVDLAHYALSPRKTEPQQRREAQIAGIVAMRRLSRGIGSTVRWHYDATS